MSPEKHHAASVMIVDDMPDNLRLLEDVLQEHHFHVRSFRAGRLALSAATEDPPDLLLLDVHMPEMNGYEVCTRFKADPQLERIPIIFISAASEPWDKVRAFREGGVDYVTKPFQVEEVLARIRTHLRLAHLQRELETFACSVSHDLRAPLRGIIGFSQLLAQDHGHRMDLEGKRLLQVIGNQAQRMSDMIGALLAFSQLDRHPILRTTIAMTSLVEEIWKELLAQPASRKAVLQTTALPPALGDPALVRQVLVNLLSNALKYSAKHAHPRIEVGSVNEDRDTVYYVKDNGAGFDMRHAGRLFGVFQRLHSSADFEGTGVGLALVRRIIHRHGGWVKAEGRPGEGATFWFTLPGKPTTADPPIERGELNAPAPRRCAVELASTPSTLTRA